MLRQIKNIQGIRSTRIVGIIVGVGLLISLNVCQAQKGPITQFPSIYKVIEEFGTHYSVPEGYDDYNFEKKENGYYVFLIKWGSNEHFERQLFYAAQDKKYLPLKYPTSNSKSAGLLVEKLGNSDFYRFDICPRYGYAGWALESVECCGNIQTAPDSILYGIGLSWSNHATNLLDSRFGQVAKGESFGIGNGPDALNPEQLKTYSSATQKAIEYFGKARDLNPEMPTMIGSMHSKWSTEFMNAWLNMWIYQNEGEANKWLREDLFDDLTLSLARNTLITCDSDAYLFTNGDMDTYPVIYVQLTENLRKDVKVINCSMLNSAHYVSALRRNYGISFTLSDKEIADDASWYLMFTGDNPIAYTDLINAFRLRNEGETVKINANAIWFPAFEGGKSFTAKPDKSFLIRGEWLIWDIIFNNKGDHPIYLARTAPTSNFVGLERQFELKGLSQKLIYNTPQSTESVTREMASLVKGQMEWKLPENYNPADRGQYIIASGLFIEIAVRYLREGDVEKANNWIANTLTYLPNEKFPYGTEAFYLASFSYKGGDIEMGNKLLLILGENIKNKKLSASESIFRKMHLDELLDYARELAIEYEQPQIAKKLPKEVKY